MREEKKGGGEGEQKVKEENWRGKKCARKQKGKKQESKKLSSTAKTRGRQREAELCSWGNGRQ